MTEPKERGRVMWAACCGVTGIPTDLWETKEKAEEYLHALDYAQQVHIFTESELAERDREVAHRAWMSAFAIEPGFGGIDPEGWFDNYWAQRGSK
jgi:hypothetical protein